MTHEIVQVEKVCKCFPKSHVSALDEVTLSVGEGKLLALLGPSGCGKTTLLRLIAGFDRPDTGTIAIAGRTVASPSVWVPPERRRVGMVFQEFALFPHLTVTENIAFGLQDLRKKQPAIAKERVREAISLVELDGFQNRYPHELSGGQRQRVALARALAPQPLLVLLDEPLSNLDVQVRVYLRHEIRKILKATGTTAIFVTHDREEALAISDTIGVMRDGQLEQLDTPERIYQEPASRFVAQFVTQANFLHARRNGQLWETEVGSFYGRAEKENEGERAEVMIREEDVELSPDDTGNAMVCDRQFLGREHRYALMTSSGQQLYARIPHMPVFEVGSRVRISICAENLTVFLSQ